MKTLALSLALVGILIPSPAAHAKTLKVPDDHPDINAALAAASPNDKIVVKAGTYVGRVTVPPWLDGLSLVGKGKVIIDPEPTESGVGTVLFVLADRVRVKNLLVRHGRQGHGLGSGVHVEGDECTLEEVRVEDCDAFGVFGIGDDLVLRDVRVEGAFGGVVLSGDRARLIGVVVDTVEENGIQVTGDHVDVKGAKVNGAEIGCRVNGEQSTVRSGRFSNCNEGIRAYGLNADLRDNVVAGFGTVGIRTSGPFARVRDNEVGPEGYVESIGIWLTNGDAVVSGNDVRGVSNGIVAQGKRGRIKKNDVRGCGDAATSGASIAVSGNDSDVLGNVVRDSVRSGIEVKGHRVLVAGNDVSKSLRNGIVVRTGDGHQVIDNDVVGNHGDGIANLADGTELCGNTVKKNRTDISNDGQVALFEKNIFVTGGVETASEID